MRKLHLHSSSSSIRILQFKVFILLLSFILYFVNFSSYYIIFNVFYCLCGLLTESRVTQESFIDYQGSNVVLRNQGFNNYLRIGLVVKKENR